MESQSELEMDINKTGTRSSDLMNYSQNTTCHGVGYIFHPNHGPMRKVIWLVLYLACFTSYLYFCTTAIIRFLGNPVTTNIKLVRDDSMEFPTFTVCSADHHVKPSYYFQAVQNGSLPRTESLIGYVQQQVRLKRMDIGLKIEDLWNMQESQLMEEIGEKTYSAISDAYRDAVENVDWQYHNIHGGPQFKDIIYTQGDTCAWSENNNPFQCKVRSHYDTLNWGRLCHTITFLDNGTNAKTKSGNQAIGFNLRKKTIDLDNNTNLFAIIQSETDVSYIQYQSKLVTIGKYHIFALERTEVFDLPPPYGNCVDTEQAGFNNSLRLYPYYSATACASECSTFKLVEGCGCAWDGHANRLGVQKCDPEIDTPCSHNVASKTDCSHCAEACHRIKYDIEHQVIENGTNFPVARDVTLIFKEKAYTEIRQIPAYTFDSLFGDIGGQLGLFIGASLLSVGEIFDLALVSIFKKCLFSRDQTNVII